MPIPEAFDDASAWFAEGYPAFRAATDGYSTLGPVKKHRFYQSVLNIGPALVPTLALMIAGGDHTWLTPLRQILGDGPTYPEDELGKIASTTYRMWEWLREKGHLKGLFLGAFNLRDSTPDLSPSDGYNYDGASFHGPDEPGDLPAPIDLVELIKAEVALRSFTRIYTLEWLQRWALDMEPEERARTAWHQAQKYGRAIHTTLKWESDEYWIPTDMGILERTSEFGHRVRLYLLCPEGATCFLPPLPTAYHHMLDEAP